MTALATEAQFWPKFSPLLVTGMIRGSTPHHSAAFLKRPLPLGQPSN